MGYSSSVRETRPRRVQVWGIWVSAVFCLLDTSTCGLRLLFDCHEACCRRFVRPLARDIHDWRVAVELVGERRRRPGHFASCIFVSPTSLRANPWHQVLWAYSQSS